MFVMMYNHSSRVLDEFTRVILLASQGSVFDQVCR